MLNGYVCTKCERFQHRNGNRTPDAWWKQPTGLCERGGPFVVDPLDVVIDGVTLRDLVWIYGINQREVAHPPEIYSSGRNILTPDQRKAVSAYWSAQLRTRVAASAAADAERNRLQVVLEHDIGDSPW